MHVAMHDTDQTEVIGASSERPVLVDFWGRRCGPCLKMMLHRNGAARGRSTISCWIVNSSNVSVGLTPTAREIARPRQASHLSRGRRRLPPTADSLDLRRPRHARRTAERSNRTSVRYPCGAYGRSAHRLRPD
jgi:hypothetical protein